MNISHVFVSKCEEKQATTRRKGKHLLNTYIHTTLRKLEQIHRHEYNVPIMYLCAVRISHAEEKSCGQTGEELLEKENLIVNIPAPILLHYFLFNWLSLQVQINAKFLQSGKSVQDNRLYLVNWIS